MKMKITALAAVGLAGLMLAACAPRYYDDGYYYRGAYRDYRDSPRYYDNSPYPGGVYYSDRQNSPYYTDNPSREHRAYGESYNRLHDHD
jgi:hypothetical protein